MQISNADALLNAYRRYSENSTATADDLFAFITTPTPERDVFLINYCTCTISVSENIVLSTYTPL